MHDAQLHARLRIGRVNRFGKTGEAVDAGYENIAQPAVLQIGEAGQPELGALVLAEPQSDELFVPFQIHA